MKGSPDARILADLADFVVLVAGYGRDTPSTIAQAAANFDPAKFAGVRVQRRRLRGVLHMSQPARRSRTRRACGWRCLPPCPAGAHACQLNYEVGVSVLHSDNIALSDDQRDDETVVSPQLRFDVDADRLDVRA